jgi:hypothetical protein
MARRLSSILLVCVVALIAYRATRSPFYVRVYANPTTAPFVGPNPWTDASAPEFGISGNGSTDDTAAMSAAIAACPTSGCAIFIPNGANVLVTSCLQVTKPIHFFTFARVVNGNAEVNETGFSTKTANCIFQAGTINNGSASHLGPTWENLFFRDTSAGKNTALGGVFITDTNNANCFHCSFEDFGLPATAAPPAPSIAAAGSGTNWWVETACVNNVGGKTKASAESTLSNQGATLTVTGLTAGNCPAPMTGYVVFSSTAGSGQETIQSGSSCTLNAAGTGCGLGNNWVGTQTAGSLTLKAVQYDTSAGFGWLQDANSGASGTAQDSSYGMILNPQCRGTQECYILDGGFLTVIGGHANAPANYAFLVNNYQAAQLMLYGGGMELANTTTQRGIILNSQSSSSINGFKFEGSVNANTNVTCAEVNTSRNSFLGDTWVKCGAALIQENAGVASNTYDIHLATNNAATTAITGLTAEDIVIGDNHNGNSPVGAQFPIMTVSRRLNQSAANTYAGTATLAGNPGTVTVTFPNSGYASAPVCTANDTSGFVSPIKVVTTASNVTISENAASTDTVSYICVGNPN